MENLSVVADATDTLIAEADSAEAVPVADAPEMTPEGEAPDAAEVEASKAPAANDSMAGLPAPIRDALIGRGFQYLTVVQSAVLKPGAAGRDLQISSQTGSGKTVALGLVLAPGLLDFAESGDTRTTRALVIAPTRELAMQVSEELKWLYASVPGLRVECVTGGTSVGMERHRLKQRPMVIVGTPGRMLDHIRSGAFRCDEVEQLVLDEADLMLDMGFRDELEAILEAVPSERSTHLVSATFASAIQRLAKKYQNKPLAVEGTRLGAANQDIQHVGHVVRFGARYGTVVNSILLAEDQRALIFVNTRAEAGELAAQLAEDGFAAAPISGDLEQAQRTRTLTAFRNRITNVLVATDVAARGLDIPDVDMVIHTDAPKDSESYTHRAGRTGRAGRKGLSVLLVSPSRRRKVEGLLRRARVQLEWQPVPDEGRVKKELAKRARVRLNEALKGAADPTTKQLRHASRLIEEEDPATVVAKLVALCGEAFGSTGPGKVSSGGAAPVAPQAVQPAAVPASDSRPVSDRHSDNRPARNERDRKHSRREDRDEAPARRGRPRTEVFEINVGSEDGATPQRLVPVICERGGITSQMIGSIRINPYISSFEVSAEVARDFERRALVPDRYDPETMFRRAPR